MPAPRITLRMQSLVSFGFEEPLYFNGGHASGARSGDGLPVSSVLNITGVKNARHVGACAAMRSDVAVGIEIDLAREGRRIGDVADGDEEAVDVALPNFIRQYVAELHTGD